MNTPQPTLDQIDPALLDARPVPPAFIELCLSPEELMDRLGIEDVSQFWLAVRDGRIPRGVFLPVNPPMCCWDSDIIEKWIECGCPGDPIHDAHRTIVLKRLVDCVQDTLSANPPTLLERN